MKVRFKKLQRSDLSMVLGWRTKAEVTKWLFTDIDPDSKKQEAWFERLSDDNRQRFWIIKVDGLPIGAFYLKDIDWEAGAAEIGYYFANQTYKGLAAMIPPMFYNWGFQHGFHTFVLHVFEDHRKLVNLHKLHGFRFIRRLPAFAKQKDVIRMELDEKVFAGFNCLPTEVET